MIGNLLLWLLFSTIAYIFTQKFDYSSGVLSKPHVLGLIALFLVFSASFHFSWEFIKAFVKKTNMRYGWPITLSGATLVLLLSNRGTDDVLFRVFFLVLLVGVSYLTYSLFLRISGAET